MGIFGRRKAPAPDVIPVDPDEEKTRKMIEVASVIDQKIELSDKKVAALEVKRGTILDRAKIARKEKRDLEAKRLCINIKQCDENIKRQQAMGIKLNKVKNLCEQYLEQNDYIITVTSAVQLMEKYGVNEKQAEIVMDKLQALKDRTDDINETMMEGAEEELDEADEMMDELDALIAEDEKKEAMGSLPSAPTTVHSAVAKPAPAKATAAEESLEGMLDAL